MSWPTIVDYKSCRVRGSCTDVRTAAAKVAHLRPAISPPEFVLAANSAQSGVLRRFRLAGIVLDTSCYQDHGQVGADLFDAVFLLRLASSDTIWHDSDAYFFAASTGGQQQS